MKKSRFTDEQIVKILTETDKDPVAALTDGLEQLHRHFAAWAAAQANAPAAG